MAEPLRFERSARGPRALALIGTSLAAIIALLLLGGAWWITAALALLTLPAAIEAIRDARATLTLDDHALSWASGRRAQSVPLPRIAEVRLATTLDFSQRATVHADTGQTLRIPPECLPPGRALDEALTARAIPHRRSLFGF
jgi:uncharacterized membrane protein YdbT with pleckstrin-like domain